MNTYKGTIIMAKQRELQSSLWIYQPQSHPQQQQAVFNERNDRDRDVAANSSESDLFALDYDDGNYDSNTSSGSALKKHFESHIGQRMKKIALGKLCVVKLDSISIPSKTDGVQHVLNLKQEFNFSPLSKSLKDSAVQTPNLLALRQKTPHPKNHHNSPVSRPASFPNEALSSHKINDERVTADIKPIIQKPEYIGDGIQNNLKQIKKMECDLVQNDLEITGVLPVCQNPVQCVLIKPKKYRQSTPLYTCKKTWRPQTRHYRKKGPNTASTNSSNDDDKKISSNNDAIKRGKIQNDEASHLMMRNNDLITSEASTEAGLDVYGNHYSKLCSVVDKLQDHEWEVCLDGLRSFQSLAAAINWESELGIRFIPIISRKLIDFFKSPRSNLCRTACQTAGEFFLLAKSTKRPEFDEMVDILLCKCADPNRFIQKDANVALDKMAMCINIHHSVRAITVKGADHKNPIVRATAARLLTHICKQAGVEQIVGVDANPRTRKRVLSNLGKFLMDKYVETRRHAEKLCRILKRHKFFMEYFFKDIEINSKGTLRKILNSIN